MRASWYPGASIATTALVIVLLTATACASDGRDLAAPSSDQTTTTRPAPPTSAPDQEPSASGLALTSPAFEPGGMAPRATQCLGDNRFPTLDWAGVPAGTAELVVTLSDQTDPKSPTLIWMMGGIDPSTSGLKAGTLPTGAFETLNDYGQPGYGNPCLEAVGDGLRDLQFRLYALPVASGLEAGAHGHDAWDTATASAFDTASLLMRIQANAP